MVKLFNRSRSKTAGAVSISSPVLHNIEPFRPDLLPINNVTTVITADTNRKPSPPQPASQGQSTSKPRLHRRHTSQDAGHGIRKPKRSEGTNAGLFSDKRSNKQQKNPSQKSTPVIGFAPPGNPIDVPKPHGEPSQPHGSVNLENPDRDGTPEKTVEKEERPMLKRRPSKWKKVSSLLRSREQDIETRRSLPPPPQQSRALHSSSAAAPPLPQTPSNKADTRANGPPTICETQHTIQEGSSTSQKSRPNTAGAATPPSTLTPYLDVQMPNIRMERYSIMFNNVMAQQQGKRYKGKEQSGLLARREKKLQRLNLNAANHTQSPESTARSHLDMIERGHNCSPYCSEQLQPPGRSPLRRSNTAPPSPNKLAQISSPPGAKPGVQADSDSQISPRAQIPRRRSRSLNSDVAPCALNTDTSDDEDEKPCGDDEDGGDVIVVHSKAPVWEDPHEPKWEIINPPKKKPTKFAAEGNPPPPLPTRRQTHGHLQVETSFDLPRRSSHPEVSAPRLSLDTHIGSSPFSAFNAADATSHVHHPALARLTQETPPIPPKSPARSSISTTASCYQSAVSSLPASPLALPLRPNSPGDPHQKSPCATPTQSTAHLNVQSHANQHAHAPFFHSMPHASSPHSSPYHGKSAAYVPSNLSSNITSDLSPIGGEDERAESPKVVEVSIARSISVSRRSTRSNAANSAIHSPHSSQGDWSYSGRAQLVRSRSKSAGPGAHRRPATRA